MKKYIVGVGVLEGPMYAVGGHDGWSYLNTVERWDPQAKQWSYVAPMSTPRSTVGVAVLFGKYVSVYSSLNSKVIISKLNIADPVCSMKHCQGCIV